jgi:very-short-patch-repair endonuclease
MDKVFNQKQQKSLRQSLRRMPIGCERKLWSKLRNKQLGYKFRRQYGISNYIVDFYCPALRLVIEIDGATHGTEDEVKRDIIRQKFLESLGLAVRRYNNADIKNNFSDVIYDIQQACSNLNTKYQILALDT